MAQEGIGPFFQRQGMPEIVVFAGKGGLGKTTCSAALSYWYSQKDGKKTLCFSTDPQASLSDIFEKDIFGKGLVQLAPNLDVVEIDADRRVSDYQLSVKKKIVDMYGLDELPLEIEEYIDSTSAEPAMYESATYDAMADLVAERDHDLYVFDMPPFGHGVRMVAMAEILSKWVEKITEAREKAQEYEAVAATLRGQRFEAGDEVLNELLDIRAKITTFTDMLTDRKRTGFFMVLVPEKMAILDTERALGMFERLDITLSGLILNQVYPRDLMESPKVGEFLKNRVRAQEPYIKEIKEKFGDLVVATLPMYVREPKGMDMIAQVAEDLINGKVVV
jgi:arsenite-transporting ATPase